jgi:hypothetical protein
MGVGVGDHTGVGDLIVVGVGDRIDDPIGDRIDDPIGDRIDDPIGDRIGDRIDDPIGDLMGDFMGDLMGDFMGDLMADLMGDLMSDLIDDPMGDLMARMDLMGDDLDGDGLRDLGDPIHFTMGGIVYIHIIYYIFTLRVIVRIFVPGFRLSFVKVVVIQFLMFVSVLPRGYLVYMLLYKPYGAEK